MGPTGCGKTSLLEAICGLRPLAAGTIELDGHKITQQPPAARGIGYVPQDGALFRHMSVRDNIAFGLMVRGMRKSAIDIAVNRLAADLAIRHLLDRGTQHLSGGEIQRVALARALAIAPRLLLLDEPLSALDEPTRQQMTTLLKQIQQQHRTTVLHVTHSSHEAAALADVRFAFRDGQIVAVAGVDTSRLPHASAPSAAPPAGLVP
jgi:ABC-type sugar transport system ATPase subunit